MPEDPGDTMSDDAGPTTSEAAAHTYARDKGVSGPLYRVVRAFATVLLRGWFRFRVTGREHIPENGPAIISPNHKNFLDPFFIGLATRRRVRYMAKAELLAGFGGGVLMRLGAFPVRRGRADTEALDTARAILGAGGVVVLFPEGTRVEEPDALGSPRHGAGRLAFETGSPIIPAAISGTSHLWRGALPKVRRVQVAFLPAVTPKAEAPDPEALTELIDARVWPAVQEEYGRLRATPGLVLAGLAAIGIGGGLVARRRAKAKTKLLGRVEPRKLRRH
jgi:1-acyl-sn-glycerol-3-phosphate acyltransferase